MPAVSVSERKFFGMCEHNPKHANGKCPDMSKSQMHDFAATKDKGLPQRKNSLKNQIIGRGLSKGGG